MTQVQGQCERLVHNYYAAAMTYQCQQSRIMKSTPQKLQNNKTTIMCTA